MILRGCSVKVRAALNAAATMLVAIMVTYVLVLVLFSQDRYQEVRAYTADIAQSIAAEAVTGVLPRPLPVAGASVEVQVLETPGKSAGPANDSANGLAASRRVLTGSADLIDKAPLAVELPKAFDQAVESTVCPPDGCLHAVAMNVRTPYGPVSVVAVHEIPSLLPPAEVLLEFIMVALVFVAVAGFGTWFIVGRSLQPVERIRRRLGEITATNLSARVPIPKGRDEVTRLAGTVNETLDRLETSVESHKSFVANASHELRNPVAALQTLVEVARLYPDRIDLEHTLNSIEANSKRLGSIIEDLLLLARIDARRSGAGLEGRAEVVDLAFLVRQELAARVHRKGVALRTDVASDPVPVEGNPSDLTRLFANLLDNAERHTAGVVRVRVAAKGARAVLEVSDDGAGIEPADRERVFDRFTRLADGRKLDPDGSGLGLALVRDVAIEHNGTIAVLAGTGDTPGARLTLTLPLQIPGPVT